MKIVLIEDETLAAEKLERYLSKYNAENSIVQKLTSISESVNWFQNNQDFDDMLHIPLKRPELYRPTL